MKKIRIALVLAAFLLCCACSASPESTATAGTEKTQAPLSAVTLPETGGIEVGVFSFESAMAYYAAFDGEGIVREGFVNTEPVTVATAEEALARAEREIHPEAYETSDVYHDPETGAWLVSFGMGPDVCGGNADVYLDADGVTRLMFFGE